MSFWKSLLFPKGPRFIHSKLFSSCFVSFKVPKCEQCLRYDCLFLSQASSITGLSCGYAAVLSFHAHTSWLHMPSRVRHTTLFSYLPGTYFWCNWLLICQMHVCHWWLCIECLWLSLAFVFLAIVYCVSLCCKCHAVNFNEISMLITVGQFGLHCFRNCCLLFTLFVFYIVDCCNLARLAHWILFKDIMTVETIVWQKLVLTSMSDMSISLNSACLSWLQCHMSVIPLIVCYICQPFCNVSVVTTSYCLILPQYVTLSPSYDYTCVA